MTARFGTQRVQTSWLELTTPSVAIDERGCAHDPYALIRHGFWDWERFAEELPLDYLPQ